MKVEVLLPQLGESISEATILRWLNEAGSQVKKDEPLVEISTDKVDTEVPAPASGTLVEIRAKQGETVKIRSVIALIETEAAAAQPPPEPTQPVTEKPEPASPPPPPSPPQAGPPAPEPGKGKRPKLKSPLADDAGEFGVGVSEIKRTVVSAPESKVYSPLVQNIAVKEGLSEEELTSIQGTGPQGRVTKADVLEFLKHRKQPPAAPVVHAAQVPEVNYNTAGVSVEPFDNMRKRIAEHMVRSKATSPHVYTVAEVDLYNIARWREKQQDIFLKKEGFKLSFTPFFLEAAAKSLVQFPRINASVDGENLVLKKNINLGCAVALGTTGLIVPVIKNADQLSFLGLARSLNDLAARARNKKLQPDDTQGGTLTITNAGIYGSILSFPIINQPQLAIMGLGAIKKRPVVVDDMIAIHEIIYITLSYDHRVIDGALAGSFLAAVTKHLQSWDPSTELY